MSRSVHASHHGPLVGDARAICIVVPHINLRGGGGEELGSILAESNAMVKVEILDKSALSVDAHAVAILVQRDVLNTRISVNNEDSVLLVEDQMPWESEAGHLSKENGQLNADGL